MIAKAPHPGARAPPPQRHGLRKGRTEPEIWSPPLLPDLPDRDSTRKEPAGESRPKEPRLGDDASAHEPPLEPLHEPLGDEPPVVAERQEGDAHPDYDDAPPYDEPSVQPIPGTVGALLAETRIGFGQSIDEVSSALRIRPVFLRAIEEARHQDLPGLAYAVGFRAQLCRLSGPRSR